MMPTVNHCNMKLTDKMKLPSSDAAPDIDGFPKCADRYLLRPRIAHRRMCDSRICLGDAEDADLYIGAEQNDCGSGARCSETVRQDSSVSAADQPKRRRHSPQHRTRRRHHLHCSQPFTSRIPNPPKVSKIAPPVDVIGSLLCTDSKKPFSTRPAILFSRKSSCSRQWK